MSDLLCDFESAVRGWNLAGKKVLCGVSGGADSIALLQALNRSQSEIGFAMHAVHINHKLRGSESEADANFVKTTCAASGIEVTIRDGHVTPGRAIEESARQVRYAEFADVAKNVAAEFVAVAHTADDQVETILHHIVRGTGPAGLAGIPDQRQLTDNCLLIRPFLKFTHHDIVKWLKEIDQPFRTDSSNAESTFTRNRIRHQLLPLLIGEFNPQVRSAILRMSAQVSELQSAADFFIERILENAIVDAQHNVCRVRLHELNELPDQIVRQCFVSIWKAQHWPRKRMNYSHWNSLAEITRGQKTAVSLPGGIYAKKRNQLIVLTRNDDTA